MFISEPALTGESCHWFHTFNSFNFLFIKSLPNHNYLRSLYRVRSRPEGQDIPTLSSTWQLCGGKTQFKQEEIFLVITWWEATLTSQQTAEYHESDRLSILPHKLTVWAHYMCIVFCIDIHTTAKVNLCNYTYGTKNTTTPQLPFFLNVEWWFDFHWHLVTTSIWSEQGHIKH